MVRAFLVILLFIGNTKANISWETDLDTAFKRAEKENKIIFVYLYSPKCHYCKDMEKKVFTDKKIQEIITKHFIPVKIRKCTDDGHFIKVQYGFIGTPMFYFIDKNGELIKSIFGAWEKKDFLKILEYFSTGSYKKIPMTEYFMK
ncbi:MAG: DUF255 domain-containing protein [Aquificae bacterium]|nr:DUF255 domain-containing protein [Aquificota bacterium]